MAWEGTGHSSMLHKNWTDRNAQGRSVQGSHDAKDPSVKQNE